MNSPGRGLSFICLICTSDSGVLISLLCLVCVIDGQIIEQLKMAEKAQEKVQMEPLLFLQVTLGSVMM